MLRSQNLPRLINQVLGKRNRRPIANPTNHHPLQDPGLARHSFQMPPSLRRGLCSRSQRARSVGRDLAHAEGCRSHHHIFAFND